MRATTIHLSLLLLCLSLFSCGKTPGGVLSMNEMADLIADLQLADAYIETHNQEFESDSSKLVIKQSVFKKHGITQQDYDSSLVWYAHNMEDYIKAYDKAAKKLQHRYDKLDKGKGGNDQMQSIAEAGGPMGQPTHNARPAGPHAIKRGKLLTDSKADSIDMWQGKRCYQLTQGDKRGFITFDLPPDAGKKPGDRYELSYKLNRGGNEFKVSLNVDYIDGGTAQITRATNSDGWTLINIQSDSTRQVRRIYGYVSYDIKRGHTAYVDSLTLMRTHMNKSNYGFIHAQRLFERNK